MIRRPWFRRVPEHKGYDPGYVFRAYAVEPPPPLPPQPVPRYEPPPKPGPRFDFTRAQLCRGLGMSVSSLHRWERVGLIWEYSEDAPDGHFVTLPSGRKRYSLTRIEGRGSP